MSVHEHNVLLEQLTERLKGGVGKQGDETKFTPRKYYKTTQTPGGGLAMNSVMWVSDFDSPPAGKIWNLRFAIVFTNDATNGAFIPASSTPPYLIAIGNPNHPDGFVQTAAQANLEESLYFDSVGGSGNSSGTGSSIWSGPGLTLSRYTHWVWPNERVYAIVNAAFAALLGNTDVILSYRVDEYDQDRITYGQSSTNQVLAFRESLTPPRQQA